MKGAIFAVLAIAAMTGCAPKPADSSTDNSQGAAMNAPQSGQPQAPPPGQAPVPGGGSAAAGNAGGITPIGPNVGPMTPVAGGENLGEGGGSVGQAAKNQARKAAAAQSQTSATGGDD